MGDYFVKIYGAPYTFDLYKGTEQELNYFQTFDNGGTEPVKMTIHRLANGWIAYNYLRYGFVTSGGRTGSFFGMSVVFNRMFCSDFTSIYDLFDGIYQALSKKAVLFDTPDQGKPKYKIRNFADAENVMQWIEGVVRQNLQDGLANDLHPAQFPQSSNSGMEMRLTPKDGNSAIVEALKKYAMVSISPLFAGGNDDPVRIVPPEVLMELSNNIYEISEGCKKLSDKVDAFQKDFKALKDTGKDVTQLGQRYQLLMGEISRATGRTDDSISKIQQWLAIKPVNASSLTTPGDNLSRLREKLYALSNTMSFYQDEVIGQDGPGPGPGPGPEPWPWWKIFIDKHKKIIAASAALVLVIGTLVILYPKDNKSTPEMPKTEKKGESPREANNKDDKISGNEKASTSIGQDCSQPKENKTTANSQLTKHANAANPLETGTKNNEKKPSSTPQPLIQGTIQLKGDGAKDRTTVIWNKDVTLHFEPTMAGDNINKVEWKVDDQLVGSKNDLKHKFKFEQDHNYTIKCYVNGNSEPSATATSIKCVRE